VTITEDKPATDETPDETPDNVIVSEPRPVAVGDVVVKTAHPRIYDGLVLHVDTSLDGIRRAWLVGRREEGGAWSLIRAGADNLARRDLAGDVPGYGEIGAALAAKQGDMEAAVEARRTAEAQVVEARNRFTTRDATVREAIVEKGDYHSWPDDEVNDLLRELGLDEKTRTFRVNVDVRATQSVYVTVEATDLDDAIEQVENDSDLVADAIDNHDWEWDTDSWEVDRYNSSEDD
jgi:hypothetical protein